MTFVVSPGAWRHRKRVQARRDAHGRERVLACSMDGGRVCQHCAGAAAGGRCSAQRPRRADSEEAVGAQRAPPRAPWRRWGAARAACRGAAAAPELLAAGDGGCGWRGADAARRRCGRGAAPSIRASRPWRRVTSAPRWTAIRMIAASLVLLSMALWPAAQARQQLPRRPASARRAAQGEALWWMPAARLGSVGGGSLLTFAGTHFDLSAPYVARFTGVDDGDEGESSYRSSVEAEAAPVLALSRTQLVVAVPAWPGHETEVTVSLLEAGSVLASAPGNDTSFEYLAEVTSMQGSTAPVWHPPSQTAGSSYSPAAATSCSPGGPARCSAPVSGGAHVTVSGSGFQQRRCPENDFCSDVQYALLFYSATDAVAKRGRNACTVCLPASFSPDMVASAVFHVIALLYFLASQR